jgi:phosphoglycerol transferase MdoB-like AlkP superfamily enzyme
MYVNKVLEVLRMIKLSIDARQFPPLIVVPVFGVLVAYATEVITTQGFIPPITPRYFLLTAFVFVVLLVFFYALTNRLWLSTLIVFCGAYALSYASFVKMEYRDEPLYFDDLSMTVKIFGFVDGDMVYATPYTAFPLIAGLAAIALVFVFSKVKTVGKGRLLTLAASAVCLSVLFFFAFFVPEHADAKDTGFVLGFISEPLHRDRDRAKQGDAPATENPSAPTDAQTDWGTPTTAAVPSEETPNVIIILSESFWDPYQMDNLTLSADPIPNFRRISETAVSGHLLSCTYAGGTDAVELSLLTGFTGRLLGVKGDVYDSWLLDNPATSLARVFWEKGYETRAVHTYHRDFYNRDIAFPKLGFGLFLGSEDMDITDSKGPYIDDKDLTRYILESYEDVAAKGRPAFILGISMQNHQSYGGRFESNPIHVVDDSMPEDLKDNVECYIHGLVDADVELGRIID